jgi:hypothetical protein
MKKIKVKWAKHEESNKFNFGDDLNPYIIEGLSGLNVDYIHFASSRLVVVKQFLKGFYKTPSSIFWFTKSFFKSFFSEYYILAIGSILQWYSSKRAIVWGAGIISKTSNVKASNFLAVRGHYTKNRLKELGYNSNIAIGDPALLLPLLYTPRSSKKYKLGIIPHISHYQDIKQKLSNKNKDIHLIDLNTSDIESVVNQIYSCEKILSTSLHGIIVSHAYGVNAIWANYTRQSSIGGDNVKFLDYFSSVDINNYSPYQIDFNGEVDIEKIENLFSNYHDKAIPQIEIRKIQKDLIRVAPFSVLEKFKEI